MIIVVTIIITVSAVVVIAVPVRILICNPLVHAQNWTSLPRSVGNNREIVIHSPTYLCVGDEDEKKMLQLYVMFNKDDAHAYNEPFGLTLS